jgi:hypothetical protein
MEEIWKDVPGFEGQYRASTLGRIKSLKRKRVPCDKILCENSTNKSYLMVSLNRKGTAVHRIIANTFLDNPENLPIVDHKDGNIKNNAPSNLAWKTISQNVSEGKRRKKGLR